MLGDQYACKNFAFKDQIFSLHGGILIDMETPDPIKMQEELAEKYDWLIEQGLKPNDKVLDVDTPIQEHYDVPTVEVNGKQ